MDILHIINQLLVLDVRQEPILTPRLKVVFLAKKDGILKKILLPALYVQKAIFQIHQDLQNALNVQRVIFLILKAPFHVRFALLGQPLIMIVQNVTNVNLVFIQVFLGHQNV